MEAIFSSDLPIRSWTADRLNRAQFAKTLAKALTNWKQQSSLVVGLYGDWGSGKSSLKNMALEYIQQDSPKRTIVEFNPWQVSNYDKIAETFFHEVGTALGAGQIAEDAEAGKR